MGRASPAAEGERTTSRLPAARAKEWFLTAFGLSVLLKIAQDVFDLDGTAWIVIRVAIVAGVTALLFAWIFTWLGELRRSGGWRGIVADWASSTLLAVAVVGVIVLAGLLIDDIAS